MLKLYDYFRSSAAYRVRIALNLKKLAYQSIPIHLTRGGGEQFRPEYRTINPEARVPTLDIDGKLLRQSLAIIEYLDETQPDPPLLPRDPLARAQTRAIALAIACDIHPLNNTRPLNYMRKQLGLNDEQVNGWYRNWVETGLAAIETSVTAQPRNGDYCMGAAVTVADICLVPQMANARRFNCDLSVCPTLVKIDAACRALREFAAAAPEKQPDAE